MRVLVYQDYVHNNGLLLRALDDRFGHSAVQFCDAADIVAGALDDTVKLFVMPGGADLYYCEKLNGAGNAAIRAWAERGGAYLGICAGAYYACARVAWAVGTPREIAGGRELQFFAGQATGPLRDLIEDNDVDRSWNGVAALHYDDGAFRVTTDVFYSGRPDIRGRDGCARPGPLRQRRQRDRRMRRRLG